MDTFRKGCFCYKADSLPFITQKSNTELCFLYKGKDLKGKKKLEHISNGISADTENVCPQRKKASENSYTAFLHKDKCNLYRLQRIIAN